MFLRRRNKTGKRILATALTMAMLMGSFFTNGLSAQAAEGDFLQDFESYTTDICFNYITRTYVFAT